MALAGLTQVQVTAQHKINAEQGESLEKEKFSKPKSSTWDKFVKESGYKDSKEKAEKKKISLSLLLNIWFWHQKKIIKMKKAQT